jgi:hypothetical protein
MKQILTDPKIKKIAHNAKFELVRAFTSSSDIDCGIFERLDRFNPPGAMLANSLFISLSVCGICTGVRDTC